MSCDQTIPPTTLYAVGTQHPSNAANPIQGCITGGFLNGACMPAPQLLFSDPWQQNKPLMTIDCDRPQSNPQRRMALVLMDSAELTEQLCTDTLRDFVHHHVEQHKTDQSEVARHMKGYMCPLASAHTYEEKETDVFANSRNSTDAPNDPWNGFSQQTDHQELPLKDWPPCEPMFYQSHSISSRKRKFINTDLNEDQFSWRYRSR